MTTWLKRAVLLLALCFVAFAAALPDDDEVASPQWPACIRGLHRPTMRSLSGQSSHQADFSWRLPTVTTPILTPIGVVVDKSSFPKTEISVPLRPGRAPPSPQLI